MIAYESKYAPGFSDKSLLPCCITIYTTACIVIPLLMKTKNCRHLNTGLLFMSMSISALAEVEPLPIDLGGFGVVPFLSMEEKYDSNVLSSQTDIKSSALTVIAPSVIIGAEIGVNRYLARANIESGFFAGSREDNYLDSLLEANLHHEFTRRSKVDLIGQYYRAHEARGTAYSQGIGDILEEPNLR